MSSEIYKYGASNSSNLLAIAKCIVTPLILGIELCWHDWVKCDKFGLIGLALNSSLVVNLTWFATYSLLTFEFYFLSFITISSCPLGVPSSRSLSRLPFTFTVRSRDLPYVPTVLFHRIALAFNWTFSPSRLMMIITHRRNPHTVKRISWFFKVLPFVQYLIYMRMIKLTNHRGSGISNSAISLQAAKWCMK